jgi:glycosyltransferase involved in cell wall biosynthesis
MSAMVTVLIPTYNAGNYLSDALNSVFAQIYPPWKMIVIDDASTDNSLETARHLLMDDRISVIKNDANLGQSKSLNNGLAQVITPYTIQLDSDDWFMPSTLDVLVKVAEKLPEKVALISGNINMVIENTAGGVLKEEILRGRPFNERYQFLVADCSQWPRFYRTSALKHIGGWPTDVPYSGRYMEDKLILLRLIEQYSFHWVDVVLYNHRRHSNNQTNLTDVYNEMTEWTVNNALQRWGNRYSPLFRDDSFGRKRLVRLIPK